MRSKTLLLCLALLLATPAAALADNEGYARRGVYFGLHTVYAGERFESAIEDSLPGIDLSVDNSKGLNARIGYRLFPWLALEAAGDIYDNYNIELLGVDAAELDGWSVELLGKFYALTGRIQPYALLGGGYYEIELSDQLGLGLSSGGSGSIWRGGAGVELYLNQHILFKVEAAYALPLGGVEDLDFWTVATGFEYRF